MTNHRETDFDTLHTYSLFGGQARAVVLSAAQLCEDARATHALSRVATAALGRAMCATLLLSSLLKNERDSMTATLKGGGPLGAVVAVSTAALRVKGYVDRPSVELPLCDGKLDVGAAVGTQGTLTVVKDAGMRTPYVGQVALQSGEIGDDFAYYLATSEQQPSLLSLGVLTGRRVVAAGGLLIQPLPGAEEATLRALESRVHLFSDISGQLAKESVEDCVLRWFEGMPCELLQRRTPRFACDCNRERMEGVLVSLGECELREMIADQGGAQVNCHFCNTRHVFTAQDLEALIAHMR